MHNRGMYSEDALSPDVNLHTFCANHVSRRAARFASSYASCARAPSHFSNHPRDGLSAPPAVLPQCVVISTQVSLLSRADVSLANVSYSALMHRYRVTASDTAVPWRPMVHIFRRCVELRAFAIAVQGSVVYVRLSRSCTPVSTRRYTCFFDTMDAWRPPCICVGTNMVVRVLVPCTAGRRARALLVGMPVSGNRAARGSRHLRA